jgi:hypothetical protein
MLTLEHTVRSYSGRPGCMCGCRGDYKETDRARQLAITQLLKNPDVQLQSWPESGGDAGCVFVDTPTRTRALYLTQAGVDAVRAMGVKELA